MAKNDKRSISTRDASQPSYSVQAQYWPGRFGWAWTGTDGMLEAVDKSLVFVDNQQNKIVVIPFQDIKKAKFDFGKRDYLKIRKIDDSRCFFALSASGNADQRAASYNVLDQILKQNNVVDGVAVTGDIKKGVNLQRIFWISYIFRKRS